MNCMQQAEEENAAKAAAFCNEPIDADMGKGTGMCTATSRHTRTHYAKHL